MYPLCTGPYVLNRLCIEPPYVAAYGCLYAEALMY